MRFLNKLSLFAAALALWPAAGAYAEQLSATASLCYGADLAGLGLLGSDPKAFNYDVPNDGIEHYVAIGSAAQGLPETIQGIWWMDGNPGGLLVSLGNAVYDPATRTARMPITDVGTYAFHPSADAGCPEAGTPQLGGFKIQFSEDFRHAFLVNYHLGADGHDQDDGDFARFTMDLSEDGHWVRHSALFGVTIPDYHLRRIVKGDGSRDEFMYNQYLKAAGPTAVVGPHGPGSIK